MNNKLKNAGSLFIALAAVCGSACSGDSSSNTSPTKDDENLAENEVVSAKDLPLCNRKTADEVYTVLDEETDYICSEDYRKWVEVVIKSTDLPKKCRDGEMMYVSKEGNYYSCSDVEWISEDEEEESESSSSVTETESSSSIKEAESSSSVTGIESSSSAKENIPEKYLDVDIDALAIHEIVVIKDTTYITVEVITTDEKTGKNTVVKKLLPQAQATKIHSYDCSQALFCGNDMTRENRERVNTSAYADEGNEDYGWWYMETDKNSSTIYFPEGRNSWNSFAYPSVEKHGAIVGTVILGVGEPLFAGIAFPIVGWSGSANISDWAGVCIIYEADRPFSILMKPENGTILTGDNYPRVQLPATTGKSVANIPWTYFAQWEGWGLPIATSAVTQLATDFLFQLDGKAGDELNFKIYAFGKKNTCGEQ